MIRFTKKTAAWLAAPIACAALAVPATAMAAPTRSFQAAKDGLASDTEVLASANLKVARSTQLFSLVSTLLASDADVKKGLEAVKKTCGIDAINAIDDVTVGVDSHDKGGIFIGLTGVTEDQFTKCVISLAKAKSGDVVTSKKIGTEIEFSKGISDKLYVAWLANNVLFVGSNPEDEKLLKKETAGGLSKSTKMTARLGKTDVDATAFFAWTREQEIQNGITEHGGTASINYGASTFTVKLAVDLGDAKEAEKLAKGASSALGMLVPKDAPKEAQKILNSIQVKAQGSEVNVALQAAEADLQKLIAWASKNH